MATRRISTEYDLSDMIEMPVGRYHIDIPSLRETGCYKAIGEPYMVFTAEPAEAHYSGRCPICGVIDDCTAYGRFEKERLVHDIMKDNMRVDILFSGRRYKCRSCGDVFTPDLEGIMPRRQMTSRLYEYICKQSFYRSFDALSMETGLTDITIAKIFEEEAQRLEAKRGQLKAPRVLELDEKHIVNQMAAVFVDIETGELLEMKDTNKAGKISETIRGMDGYEDIQIVTIDMQNGYRKLIKELLPNATIVVDRFHVVKNMSVKVASTRKLIETYLKGKIKRITDAIERNEKEKVLNISLNNPYLFRYSYKEIAKDKHKKEAAEIAMLVKTFPEFATLYKLKVNYEKLYSCSSYEEAKTQLKEWYKIAPPPVSATVKGDKWTTKNNCDYTLFEHFASLAKSTKNWETEILNYFKPGCSFTNAATEGLNNLVESINRLGFGYKFKTLRAKALFAPLLKSMKVYTVRARSAGEIPKKRALRDIQHFMYAMDIYSLRIPNPYRFVVQERELPLSPVNMYLPNDWLLLLLGGPEEPLEALLAGEYDLYSLWCINYRYADEIKNCSDEELDKQIVSHAFIPKDLHADTLFAYIHNNYFD